MDEQRTESTGISNSVVVLALSAVIGGIAFLAWRRTAPLSRWYFQKRQQSEERGQLEPNPQANPGTVPL